MPTHAKKPAAKPTAPAKAKPTKTHVAQLRMQPVFSDRAVSVDADGGILKNVSLMTIGPALGHGFDIDATTIAQLVALVNALPDGNGVKSRFTHPAVEQSVDPNTGEMKQTLADSTGKMVGRVRNARVEGNTARGDVYLGTYAASLPGLGDVRSYLLQIAQDDPSAIGLSAVIEFDVEPQMDEGGNVTNSPARITGLQAIDFVETPAANPRGLLSAAAGATTAKLFDPRPPSGTPANSGSTDDAPADPAAAPLPVSTPDSLNISDSRGAYLRTLVEHGPQHLCGIAARHTGRLSEMQADLNWLVNTGHAERNVVGEANQWKATPKGVTAAALRW